MAEAHCRYSEMQAIKRWWISCYSFQLSSGSQMLSLSSALIGKKTQRPCWAHITLPCSMITMDSPLRHMKSPTLHLEAPSLRTGLPDCCTNITYRLASILSGDL